MRVPVLLACVLGVAGVVGPAAQPAAPARLASLDGFAIPESARFDPDLDRYYVSNVNAHATASDDNGFISLVGPDGTLLDRRFIAGGQHGVTLHGPKGMAIVGADLWVTDVTMLRRFDRRTGRPGRGVDLGPHGAVFLNDVTAAPDGTLYVSDTSLVFPPTGNPTRGRTDRVYRVSPAGEVSIAVADARLEGPNGVFWDTRANQLLIASIMGKHVYRWTAGGGLHVLASGPGGYDGVERLDERTLLVSSQDLPGLMSLVNGVLAPLVPGVSDVADIGVDVTRRRVAIPRLDPGIVEIWQLP
ncbi:MAG: SMP-30/gluconolactonase/LRE family protein [Vicinamibacterales bacterium]